MNSSKTKTNRRSVLVKFIVFSITDVLRSDVLGCSKEVASDVARVLATLALHDSFKDIEADECLSKLSQGNDMESEIAANLLAQFEGARLQEHDTANSVIADHILMFRKQAESLDADFDSIYSELDKVLIARTDVRSSHSLGEKREVSELLTKLLTIYKPKAKSCYLDFSNGVKASLLNGLKNFDLVLENPAFEEQRAKQLINLLALRSKDSSTIQFGVDHFWNPKVKVGALIACPLLDHRSPLAEKLRNELAAVSETKLRTRFFEDLTLSKVYHQLEDGGTGIICIPNGVLFRGSAKGLREQITKTGSLAAVISLPVNVMFGTSIPMSIVVLHKNGGHQNTHFIDLSEKCKGNLGDIIYSVDAAIDQHIPNVSVNVSHQDILENDFDWSVRRYVYKPQNELVATGEFTKVRLGDLVGRARPSRLDTDQPYKIIGGAAINEFGDILDSKLITEVKNPVTVTVIEHASIIFQSIGNNGRLLKVAKANAPDYDCQLACTRNHYVLTPSNDKVSLDWLQQELLTERFQKAASSMMIGAAIQRISIKDLLSIEILLPPLEAQRQIAEDARIALMKRKASEEGMEDLFAAERDAFLNSSRILKHSMGQLFPPLYSCIDTLKFHLEDGNTIDSNTTFDDMDGSALDILNSARDLLKELGSYTKLLDQEGFLDNRFVIQDIIPLIERKAKEKSETGVHVEVLAWCEDAILDCSSINIAAALDNIFTNAVRHGKVLGEDLKIAVFIEAAYEADNYHIVVANNGKSLAEGFNTARYISQGGSAGKKANTGLGGHHVSEICKQLGGRVELHDLVRANEMTWEAGSAIERVKLTDTDLTVAVEMIIPTKGALNV